MKLIVGLGNPGLCYKNTKHNAGFWIIDGVAKELKISLDKRKFNAYFKQGKLSNKPFLIVKPLTYMNLSGKSVKRFVDYYKISIEDILTIYDDISLPLGTIRIKANGSAGGHNGLRSIIEALQTNNFARLRFGIDTEAKYADLTKNVLSTFRGKQNTEIKNKTVNLAKEAVLDWFNEGIVFTMNKYNNRGRKETNHE